MLTKAVPSPAYDEDKALLATLGLRIRPPFKDRKPAGEFEDSAGSPVIFDALVACHSEQRNDPAAHQK